MGINEINAYMMDKNNIFFILRNLEVASKNKKKSFLSKLSEFGMDIAMIAAPLITYCFQINKFLQTRSSKGFSKFICLLLFLGNLFRIFFWFGTHFKKTLLFQSIGIVIFQGILIHLCVKYQDLSVISRINNTNDNDMNLTIEKPLIHYLFNWKKTFHPRYIWKWTKEIEYYKFMSFLGFTLTLLGTIIGKNRFYYHLLGILSAFFESLTCVPQVVSNYRTKNTRNISFTMMFLWLLGDSFRLYYNIKFNAPIQMITGIAIQLTLDIIVCIQICFYNNKAKTSKMSNKIKEINKIMKKIDEVNVIKSNKNNELEAKESDESEGEKNSPKLDKTSSSFPEINL